MKLIKLDVTNNVDSVIDNSDTYISRVRVTFTNKYELSVIRGMGTYGSQEGLYEIAIFDPNGNYDHTIEDIGYDFYGDDVIGYMSEDDVKKIAMFVGELK